MSNGTAARHNFLPWVRQGVATGISQPETLGAGVPGRAILPVILKVNDTDVTVNLRLYGPGDVTGIDPRQVIRTEPRPLAMEFEPNYFPAIEFDRPDFPWLFTPAKPNDQEQLRPWIFLVVVRKQEGVSLVSDPHLPLPVLEITSPANPADELPDLQDSWAWAHGQVSSSPGGPSLDHLLAHSPERTLSRLICPRKLEANTQYYACLVPAFKAGVCAGLGEEVDEDAELEPAWGPNVSDEIHLPIYFHW